MADYYSSWDSLGRYRTRLRVTELTDSANNRSRVKWELRLFGSSNWTFYGWNTSGWVKINGSTVDSWSGAKRPSGSWSASSGVVISSGTSGYISHNSNGSKSINVSSRYVTPTTSSASYLPGSSTFTTSNTFGLTDFARPPAKMAKATFSNLTNSSVTVNWVAPSSAVSITDYDLHVCTSATHSSSACTVHYSWTGGTATSKNFTGLTRGKKYYVGLRAKSSEGTGEWSDWANFTTVGYSVPSTPTGYSVTDITSGSAYTTIPSVSDNGGRALDDIQIQRNTSQSSTGATTQTRGSYNTIFMSGLTGNTDYYYRMRVHNAEGWSSWGGWYHFKTKATPSKPTSFDVNPLSSTTAEATWGPPANLYGSTVTSYTLRVAKNATFSSGLKSYTLSASATSYTITGLAEGSPYYAQIWANVAAGVGEYSDVVGFSTPAGGSASYGLYYDFGSGPVFCEVWYNDGGTWKLCEPYQNVSGDWKVGIA